MHVTIFGIHRVSNIRSILNRSNSEKNEKIIQSSAPKAKKAKDTSIYAERIKQAKEKAEMKKKKLDPKEYALEKKGKKEYSDEWLKRRFNFASEELELVPQKRNEGIYLPGLDITFPNNEEGIKEVTDVILLITRLWDKFENTLNQHRRRFVEGGIGNRRNMGNALLDHIDGDAGDLVIETSFKQGLADDTSVLDDEDWKKMPTLNENRKNFVAYLNRMRSKLMDLPKIN